MNLYSINRLTTTGDSTATTVYVSVFVVASGAEDNYNEPRYINAPAALFVPIPDFSRWEQASREMRWLNSIRWACWVPPTTPRCLLSATTMLNHQHRRALELRPIHPT